MLDVVNCGGNRRKLKFHGWRNGGVSISSKGGPGQDSSFSWSVEDGKIWFEGIEYFKVAIDVQQNPNKGVTDALS